MPLMNHTPAVPTAERTAEVEQRLQEGYRMFMWMDTLIYDLALRDLLGAARSATA
jgi:hypothetical protein